MSYLEIDEFYKKFGTCEVLKGVSFCMEKGEVVSIIGASGSGKTTLLRSINFLESIDSGKMHLDNELLIDGCNTKEKESDLSKKRLNFGLVFQSFNLFPQYTALENITLAPILKLKSETKKKEALSFKEEKEKITENALSLLKKFDLYDKADFYPCQLSGGQSQRVAIARALILSPKILCFDEPTSALDPLLTQEVLKVIRSLKCEGRTMIIVTHEMEFARSVSDKVIFMSNGIIAEEGNPNQIFGNPKTEKLKEFLRNINSI